jgi:hypothetical protein
MFPLALLLAIQIAPPDPQQSWRQPQLASDGTRIFLAFGGGAAIYSSVSEDDGESFSKPVTVTVAQGLMLGRHRGPRVGFQNGNVVITAITDKRNLFAYTSSDFGKSWAKPVRINDVEGSAIEGLHAMASGNGMMFATWLDMRLKGMRLYGSISRDGGLTWEKNVLVYESPDGHICECCHPTAMIGPGGTMYVMFRNWFAGARDMYLAVSRDHGNSFQAEKLGRGTWILNACPMDGGGLTMSSNNTVFAVWRRENKIFSGKPGADESELGTGKDASIAAGLNNRLVAAWTSPGGIEVRDSNKPASWLLAPGGAYPNLIMTGKGSVIAAFEQGNGIAIRKLDD